MNITRNDAILFIKVWSFNSVAGALVGHAYKELLYHWFLEKKYIFIFIHAPWKDASMLWKKYRPMSACAVWTVWHESIVFKGEARISLVMKTPRAECTSRSRSTRKGQNPSLRKFWNVAVICNIGDRIHQPFFSVLLQISSIYLVST